MSDRILLLLLAGCAVFGGAIVTELNVEDTGSGDPPVVRQADARTPPRVQWPRAEEAATAILARPLFSPTRQPPARDGIGAPTDAGLGDVRLTGIIIEPERRLAIFAIPGAKPISRSEGGTVNDWRVESIAPDAVALTGPTGSTTLRPKADATLVRRMPAPPPPRPAAMPGPAAALPVAPRPAAPGAGPAAAQTRRPAVAVTPPAAAPMRPASAPAATPMTPALPNPARGHE